MEGLEVTIIKNTEIVLDNEDFRIDSEYFKKEHLLFDAFLNKVKSNRISNYAKVSDGDHSKFPENEPEEVRYLQAKDIKNHFIENNNPVFIGRKYFEKNKRSHVTEENVILSIMGSVGYIAITPKGFKPTLANRAVAIVKDIKEVNPYYLFAYLSSKYGQLQIDRQKNGGVQERVNLDVLSKIKIPVLTKTFQIEIQNLVTTGQKNNEQAKTIYTQAEQVLLGVLRFPDFQTSEISSTNIKTFKESYQATSRLDAEYYQPKYDKLLAMITQQKHKRIKDIRSYNSRGLQPVYCEDGCLDVINSKHILEKSLDYNGFEKTSSNYWDEQEKARVFTGDILTYTTGANIGRTQVYNSNKKALASNHVNIIRLKEEDPFYVGFVLNSLVGRLQTEQRSAGSAQAELYPKDLDEFLIPIVDTSVQREIVDLINESLQLKAASERLLKTATEAVEIAIEQNETAAMRFIKANT